MGQSGITLLPVASSGGFGWLAWRKLSILPRLQREPCRDQLLRDGRLSPTRRLQRLSFQDPCDLGRHNKDCRAPRRIAAALTQDAPLEFELHGPNAMCCGAGSARMWLEETIGPCINVLRTEPALQREPQVVATACPHCAVMIGDGLKALGCDEQVLNRDLAELLAEAPAAEPAPK
jgi:Fe-S oxidoreductase